MSTNKTHKPGAPPLLQVHGLILLSTTLVATSFTVGKAIAPTLDPAVLVLLRFCIAVILFAPLIHYQHSFRLPSFAALGRYSLISCALVGFFYLMFTALRYTTALHTGVIFTLVPGLSSLFAAILIKERLGKYRIGSLIPATLGALWIIFEGDIQKAVALEFNKGDLIFFGGCLSMALYTPLVKLLHRGEPMAIMTFWVLATSCGWLIVLSGFTIAEVEWATIGLQTWLGIVYLSVFTTIITFSISQWATLHLGPTRVISYSFLYPLLIVIIEWLLGHELPTPRTLLGIILILPAMYVIQRGAK